MSQPDVHVLLNDRLQELNLSAALPLLSEQRRLQCLAFKHEQDRRACAAAYLLLRQGLREHYGISEPPLFDIGEHGKPTLAAHPHIHFNLSHCREAVICTIADNPVGVDIEAVRSYKPSLALYTMNTEELSQIEQSASPDAAFTRLWTMKEATLKLTGHGLVSDMGHVIDTTNYRYTTVEDSQQRYIYTICQHPSTTFQPTD